MPILLSVLTPSITKRRDKLARLHDILGRQADSRMEVITITDAMTLPLGAKRNAMMDLAQGKFVCHVDDDETLADDFFASLAPELERDVDLVAYDALAYLNDKPPFRVRTQLGAENGQPHHRPDGSYADIVRQPWFWCCWRTELARQYRFPTHYDAAEDWTWLKQIIPAVKTWRKLDKALFIHHYSAQESTFPAQ